MVANEVDTAVTVGEAVVVTVGKTVVKDGFVVVTVTVVVLVGKLRNDEQKDVA